MLQRFHDLKNIENIALVLKLILDCDRLTLSIYRASWYFGAES